ncbi:hypothetical protein LINGRAHAP2_LOCUS31797, partial [Linum grandiflorum]
LIYKPLVSPPPLDSEFDPPLDPPPPLDSEFLINRDKYSCFGSLNRQSSYLHFLLMFSYYIRWLLTALWAKSFTC